MKALGPVIPFKRSSMAFALVVFAAAVVAFVATMAFLNGKAGPADQYPAIQQQNEVTILRPEPRSSVPIDVIDGDTVRMQGSTYRLVGFDNTERGDRRVVITSANTQRKPPSAFAASSLPAIRTLRGWRAHAGQGRRVPAAATMGGFVEC